VKRVDGWSSDLNVRFIEVFEGGGVYVLKSFKAQGRTVFREGLRVSAASFPIYFEQHDKEIVICGKI
jgi:hypothetical protein